MKKGKFIVFEGIDGAGKTTQIQLLAKRLRESGVDVDVSAEPTTNESGKALRRALSGQDKKSYCEMAAMFVLDRIGHNYEIRELVDAGKTVISDRYYYSSLAYQGKATDYNWVRTMNIDCPDIRRPDVCIYLDLTPEESLKRISNGRESVEIYENLEKLTEVRASFYYTIEDLRKDGEQIFIVDASRSIEEISDEIFNIVSNI
jgi:dTMP kinase